MKRDTVKSQLSLLLAFVIMWGALSTFPANVFAQDIEIITNPFSTMTENLVSLPERREGHLSDVTQAVLHSDDASSAFVVERPLDPYEERCLQMETDQAYRDAGYTERFLVRFRPGRAASFKQKTLGLTFSSAFLNSGATSLQSSGSKLPVNAQEEYAVLILPELTAPSVFAAELKAAGVENDIVFIQPDYPLFLDSLSLTTGEPYAVDEQANLDKSILPVMEAETADKVVVAVMDTGIDASHPDLASSMLPGVNVTAQSDNTYDSSIPLASAHGTHVAGIILSAARETEADVYILPIQVFDNGRAYTSDILQGIATAEVMGATIVNCSWGSTAENPALREAIEQSSMLFVAAAGNNRRNLNETPSYPACYGLGNVISVASVNTDGGYSFFSNYDPNMVDITAVGRDVMSTLPSGGYGTMTGTSMAAAAVTGAAAAVLYHTGGTAAELRQDVLESADRLVNLTNKVTEGRRMNLANAVSGTPGQLLSLDPADDFDVHGYQPTETEIWELYAAAGKVVQVEVGYSTLLLKEDGTVWELAFDSTTPTQVVGLTDITAIAAGTDHYLALSSAYTIWLWGSNMYGQLAGGGPWTDIPRMISLSNPAIAIAAGNRYSLALLGDDTVWYWGYSGYPQFGGKAPTYMTDAQSISAEDDVWISINNGKVEMWSFYHYMLANQLYGQQVNAQVSHYTNIVSAVANRNNGYAVKSDGTVREWSHIDVFENPPPPSPNMIIDQGQVSGITNVKTITGYSHYLALRNDGSVWSWGNNQYGQLGDGTTVTRQTPLKINGLSNIIAVSTRDSRSAALGADGAVWLWGANRVYPVVVSSPPLVPTSMQLSISPENTLQIPQSGSITAFVSVIVYDQYENEMSDEVIFYLAAPYAGVSIDATTGVITVQSDAVAGIVGIEAVCGSLSQIVALMLSEPTLKTKLTIPVQAGGEYYVSVKGEHIAKLSATTYTITYDPMKLSFIRIEAGNDVTVVSNTSGALVISVSKPIPADTKLSGAIAILKFSAKASGTADIQIK